jgi:hypothetical protein
LPCPEQRSFPLLERESWKQYPVQKTFHDSGYRPPPDRINPYEVRSIPDEILAHDKVGFKLRALSIAELQIGIKLQVPNSKDIDLAILSTFQIGI